MITFPRTRCQVVFRAKCRRWVWQIAKSRVWNAVWQNAPHLNRETNNLPLKSPSSDKPLRTGNRYDRQPRPTSFSNDAPTSIWTRPPRKRKWNNCHPQPSNQIRTTPKPYTSSKSVLPCLVTISGILKRTCWCCVWSSGLRSVVTISPLFLHLSDFLTRNRTRYILFPSYPLRFG